jgi:hypothetical protein
MPSTKAIVIPRSRCRLETVCGHPVRKQNAKIHQKRQPFWAEAAKTRVRRSRGVAADKKG